MNDPGYLDARFREPVDDDPRRRKKRAGVWPDVWPCATEPRSAFELATAGEDTLKRAVRGRLARLSIKVRLNLEQILAGIP